MPEGIEAHPEPPEEAEKEKTPFEAFEKARKVALQDLISRYQKIKIKLKEAESGCEGKAGYEDRECCATHKLLERELLDLEIQAFQLVPEITKESYLHIKDNRARRMLVHEGNLDKPCFSSSNWFSKVKEQFGIE